MNVNQDNFQSIMPGLKSIVIECFTKNNGNLANACILLKLPTDAVFKSFDNIGPDLPTDMFSTNDFPSLS